VGADTTHDLTITSNDLPVPAVTYDYIGERVSSAGDFNGDTYDDMLIMCRNLSSPGGQPGVVYVVAGSADIITDVVEDGSQALPSSLSLKQNYPNPFNPVTIIKFNLTEPSNTKLTVYNILGQEVKQLLNKMLAPGSYDMTWDGTDETGQGMPSGVYMYRLTTDQFSQSRKMLLLK